MVWLPLLVANQELHACVVCLCCVCVLCVCVLHVCVCCMCVCTRMMRSEPRREHAMESRAAVVASTPPSMRIRIYTI